jgi:hypothetical protein
MDYNNIFQLQFSVNKIYYKLSTYQNGEYSDYNIHITIKSLFDTIDGNIAFYLDENGLLDGFKIGCYFQNTIIKKRITKIKN